MIINRRIATAVATGALLFNSFAVPAFAATTIQITGNGADTENKVDLDINKTNTVVQNNTANVTNKVEVDSSTGGNEAKDNLGGSVKFDTGNSDVKVAVQNMLNKNSASLSCCNSVETSVKIADNLSKSKNKVDLDLSNSNEVYQDNNADVYNNLWL